MQVLAAVILLVGVCHAGYIGPAALVRTPALDSAHIKSDRIGGNFAYSVKTAEAYAAVSPVVHSVPTAVGVSYHATPVLPAPIVHAPVVHAPVVHAPVDHAAPLPLAYPSVYAYPSAYAYGSHLW